MKMKKIRVNTLVSVLIIGMFGVPTAVLFGQEENKKEAILSEIEHSAVVPVDADFDKTLVQHEHDVQQIGNELPNHENDQEELAKSVEEQKSDVVSSAEKKDENHELAVDLSHEAEYQNMSGEHKQVHDSALSVQKDDNVAHQEENNVIEHASTEQSMEHAKSGEEEHAETITEPTVEDITADFTDEDVVNTLESRATSGNWVFKNYWWRKIEEQYNGLRDIFTEVMSARIHYFTKRSEIDRQLDAFYLNIGFEQGPLEDILKVSIDIIEKEKNKQGYLTKKESAFFDTIKEKQRQLEQLREDVKSIQELDRKIDEALELLLSQIDLCDKYQQSVWDIFKKVSHELNDKVARKQYYVVVGLVENAQHVHEYIIGPFNTYFEQLAQSVQDHTRSITGQMNVLTQEGVDLKKEALKIEKEDDEENVKGVETAIVKEKESKNSSVSMLKQEKKETQDSWLQSLTRPFSFVKDYSITLWDSLVHWISQQWQSFLSAEKDKKSA